MVLYAACDAAGIQQIEAGRQLLRERRAVRDDDQDGLLQPVKIQQDGRDVVGGGAIEVAGRLVAQEEPRLADQRAGDRHALPFAARQLRRPMVDAIGQAHLFDQLARALLVRLRSVRRVRRDERRDEHVLEHRALRQQAVVLEHEPDLLVAERREVGRAQLERVAAVERDGAGRGGSSPPRM